MLLWLDWASLTSGVGTKVLNLCEVFHKAAGVNGLFVPHGVEKNVIVGAPFSYNDSRWGHMRSSVNDCYS